MRSWPVSAFLMSAFLILPTAVFGADISFSPSNSSKGVGEEFTVRVLVNPGGETINAAEGTISFDSSTLSVSRLSRDGSSFSLWTSDPSFSNSAGTISFSGGTPSAFSGQGTVLSVTFKGKAVGSGTVSMQNGSILAADGSGTDVYTKGTDASFTITAAAEKPVAPSPSQEPAAIPASSNEILVPAPDINSSTHKKEETWYATSTAIVSWKVPIGMLKVRTGISADPEANPEEVHDPIITTQTFTELEEGVWYVSAQFKDDFEWGPIAKRTVRVDVTPPEEFDVAILDVGGESVPKFVLGTTDSLSGMSRYEIYLQGVIATTAKAEDVIDNTYPIPPQDGGAQLVLIKAYDNAGNVREVQKEMELPFVAKPKPKGAPEEDTGSGFRFEWVIIALFAFALGGLAAWQVQTKKTVEEDRARILQRVLENREKNDKVFAAMREEFEELIDDFDERPQLTAAERELLEKIREVLDISEEVVDSDIEELKKLIKEQ